MARTKQPSPLRREISDTWHGDDAAVFRESTSTSVSKSSHKSDVHMRSTPKSGNSQLNGQASTVSSFSLAQQRQEQQQQPGVSSLIICVLGIYVSFLTWALLQERITTTPYGPPSNPEIFKHPIFINTVQSAFAALTGYIYLLVSSRDKSATPSVFPSTAILGPLLLVSVTSSLASPFGYAALPHVGYITFILAKSCKLLPVMALHVGVFRRRYPLYKYAVVALVTAGVAVFTLHHDAGGKSKKKRRPDDDAASVSWGLLLLSINLLFDGLTNSTQDWMNERFRGFGGSQMMCAQNLISTLLTTAYLLLSPLAVGTSLGAYLGIGGPGSPAPGAAMLVARPTAWERGELARALAFIARHPAVGWDVLGFAACGAVGQVFIFYTLSRFSSLLLVTITVTRKMLTMVLSVVWFGHRLGFGQWVGVGLVFGGVGAEAAINRREKVRKDKDKKAAAAAAAAAKGEKAQ